MQVTGQVSFVSHHHLMFCCWHNSLCSVLGEGQHRALGANRSKVRSLKLDGKVWTEPLIEVRFCLVNFYRTHTPLVKYLLWWIWNLHVLGIPTQTNNLPSWNASLVCTVYPVWKQVQPFLSPQLFEEFGNKAANDVWGYNIPAAEQIMPDATPSEREAFIKAKYIRGLYRRTHPLASNRDLLEQVRNQQSDLERNQWSLVFNSNV